MDPLSLDPLSLGARWITSGVHREDGRSLPVLATVVEVDGSLSCAELHVAALGVLEATIDGVPVSEDVLEPGYADWRREGEHVSYDVTALMTPGRHVLRIDLGTGMYRSRPVDDRWVKVSTCFGDLAAAAALVLHHHDHGDGVAAHGGAVSTVVTGERWRATTGATLVSSWTGGETWDAAAAPDASADGVAAWPVAVQAQVPPGLQLVPRTTPPVRVVEVVPAVSTTRHGEAWVVDFGVNAAGWPVVDLPAHSTVRLRPAELLLADGGVDVRTQGWGPVYHHVSTGDAATSWRPRFMYNGLRHLEVTGLTGGPAPRAELQVLGTSAASTGSFSCSDQRLCDIWDLTRRAVASNAFSLFTDCPQREKLGYLEQAHALHDLLVRCCACEPVLERTLELAVGAQREDGSIGLYVPEWERWPEPWSGDPNWGGAVVLLARARYRASGDTSHLQRSFEPALAYLAFLLRDRDERGLCRSGLGDFNGSSTRAFRHRELVSTATLHKLLLATADTASLLGRPERDELVAQAGQVAADFGRAYERSDGTWGTGSLAEHVVTLDAGLAPPSLLDRVEQQVRGAGYVVDVGAVALTLLVAHLSAAGRHETLLGITRVSEAPGYGYMIDHGATTLTETWDGPTFGFSQNHFMFAGIATWFHEHVLGIRQRPGTTGWSAPMVAPAHLPDVTSAAGHYDAPTGTLEVSWHRRGGSFTVTGAAHGPAGALLVMPSGIEHVVRGRFEHSEREAAPG